MTGHWGTSLIKCCYRYDVRRTCIFSKLCNSYDESKKRIFICSHCIYIYIYLSVHIVYIYIYINSTTLILITAYQHPKNTILNKQNQMWTSKEKIMQKQREICRLTKSTRERDSDGVI